MSTLQHYLNVMEQFLRHCRQDLKPEQWHAFTERLSDTAIQWGYSVEEPETKKDKFLRAWRQLPPDQQDAFLREQQLRGRRKPKAVAP